MTDWSNNVTVVKRVYISGVQIHLNNKEARFLVTILGRMNGNKGNNPLIGLYGELLDQGIRSYDNDLRDIDINNSEIAFEEER